MSHFRTHYLQDRDESLIKDNNNHILSNKNYILIIDSYVGNDTTIILTTET
jgi:hypothetical protein